MVLPTPGGPGNGSAKPAGAASSCGLHEVRAVAASRPAIADTITETAPARSPSTDLPAGYHRVHDRENYTLAVPRTWERSQRPNGVLYTAVFYTAPDGRGLLQILPLDASDTPGRSLEATSEQLSRSNPGYEESASRRPRPGRRLRLHRRRRRPPVRRARSWHRRRMAPTGGDLGHRADIPRTDGLRRRRARERLGHSSPMCAPITVPAVPGMHVWQQSTRPKRGMVRVSSMQGDIRGHGDAAREPYRSGHQ